MRFVPTVIPGPVIVELELRSDDRGFFARTFCREEFVQAGLDPLVEQCNLSFNYRAGTLRGMHWQGEPHSEAKLVRCTRGAVIDVAVDLRPGSLTYSQHVAVELTADNRRALYVPPLFAHGYQTLVNNTEVTYQVSEAYAPDTERGLRHDDPAIGISWPLPITEISPKDAGWPLMNGTGGGVGDRALEQD